MKRRVLGVGVYVDYTESESAGLLQVYGAEPIPLDGKKLVGETVRLVAEVFENDEYENPIELT